MSRTNRRPTYRRNKKLRELRKQGKKYEDGRQQTSESEVIKAMAEDCRPYTFHGFAMRAMRSVLRNLQPENRNKFRVRLQAIQDMSAEEFLEDRTIESIYFHWLEGSHSYARKEIAHWFYRSVSVK